MKLIRSYQILRLLGDLAILRRKKLRAYRSIQDIQKNLLQFLISAGIRIITYQMTYQCLRDRSIYTIHGHVIAIIGCPAKSQLGKVSGSHKNAAFLVCRIHQDLSTLTCLAVLIRHIVDLRIMSDIPEMDIYRLFNIYLGKPCTKAAA